MYIRPVYKIKHNVIQISWQFQYLEFAHFENDMVILYLPAYIIYRIDALCYMPQF